MNCKPGDLAVIVRSTAGNEGKVVEVVRAATHDEASEFSHWLEGHHWWVLAKGAPIQDDCGGRYFETALPDTRLRPIRDPGDDAVDEMVLRVGAPDKVAA